MKNERNLARDMSWIGARILFGYGVAGLVLGAYVGELWFTGLAGALMGVGATVEYLVGRYWE